MCDHVLVGKSKTRPEDRERNMSGGLLEDSSGANPEEIAREMGSASDSREFIHHHRDMTDLDISIVEQLRPIFPQYSPEVFEVSVLHPTNRAEPFGAATLLQRCINDLLEQRTYNDSCFEASRDSSVHFRVNSMGFNDITPADQIDLTGSQEESDAPRQLASFTFQKNVLSADKQKIKRKSALVFQKRYSDSSESKEESCMLLKDSFLKKDTPKHNYKYSVTREYEGVTTSSPVLSSAIVHPPKPSQVVTSHITGKKPLTKTAAFQPRPSASDSILENACLPAVKVVTLGENESTKTGMPMYPQKLTSTDKLASDKTPLIKPASFQSGPSTSDCALDTPIRPGVKLVVGSEENGFTKTWSTPVYQQKPTSICVLDSDKTPVINPAAFQSGPSASNSTRETSNTVLKLAVEGEEEDFTEFMLGPPKPTSTHVLASYEKPLIKPAAFQSGPSASKSTIETANTHVLKFAVEGKEEDFTNAECMVGPPKPTSTHVLASYEKPLIKPAAFQSGPSASKSTIETANTHVLKLAVEGKEEDFTNAECISPKPTSTHVLASGEKPLIKPAAFQSGFSSNSTIETPIRPGEELVVAGENNGFANMDSGTGSSGTNSLETDVTHSIPEPIDATEDCVDCGWTGPMSSSNNASSAGNDNATKPVIQPAVFNPSGTTSTGGGGSLVNTEDRPEKPAANSQDEAGLLPLIFALKNDNTAVNNDTSLTHNGARPKTTITHGMKRLHPEMKQHEQTGRKQDMCMADENMMVNKPQNYWHGHDHPLGRHRPQYVDYHYDYNLYMRSNYRMEYQKTKAAYMDRVHGHLHKTRDMNTYESNRDGGSRVPLDLGNGGQSTCKKPRGVELDSAVLKLTKSVMGQPHARLQNIIVQAVGVTSTDQGVGPLTGRLQDTAPEFTAEPGLLAEGFQVVKQRVSEQTIAGKQGAISRPKVPETSQACSAKLPSGSLTMQASVDTKLPAEWFDDKDLISSMVAQVLMLFPDANIDNVIRLLRGNPQPYAVNNVCNYLFEKPDYPRKIVPVVDTKQHDKTNEEKRENVAASKVDYFTEYSSEVSDECRCQCYILLQNDFPRLSMRDIKRVSAAYNNHYAPTRKCIAENLERSVCSSTSPSLSGDADLKLTETGVSDDQVLKFRVKGVCFESRPLKNARPQQKVYLNDLLKEEVNFVVQSQKSETEKSDLRVAMACNELQYKEAGQLIECGCCYGEFSFELMIQCYEGHLFCKECLEGYAKEAVYGGGKAQLHCLTEGCGAAYPFSQLHRALPANILAKYQEKVQYQDINLANLDDLVRCPHCDFGALLDPGDKVLSCQNPHCMIETCRHCKENWKDHFGIPCSEMENKDETKLRKGFEEKMTAAQIRTCHRCKTGFMKSDGCNKMTCSCGGKMCYICRKPNINYNHFCQHLREPGKGCSLCTACSLWTNPDQDDARAVKEIQNQASKARKKQGFTDEKIIGAPEEPPVKKVKMRLA